jgi:hypothetical protein
MSNQPGKHNEPEERPSQPTPRAVDAIRHVGPTLEAEGIFVPTGELPENRIENEGLTETVDRNAVTADAYDREGDAMGAERLRTRLPGDTSSDPHTDTQNTAPADRGKGKNRAA